jgi:hypothetical protein
MDREIIAASIEGDPRGPRTNFVRRRSLAAPVEEAREGGGGQRLLVDIWLA